ncbi:TetR/AcrR family transcriptional regulator [Actinocorallia sp. API 0066]|uniref:TetR/AcrR family transcriptional regulator n=1 Tax=Actinocorallia sp. API 0066 TaxID=2896846 RepID=UPI001E32B7DE|nr:TetR/AcrR family transcriptional regulator [Actinocorallia sp. API 0066]MCD0452816.1 TetR/AcrR family transcriptional regulator [Actinocorallia sp. API 0066]
MDAPRASLSRDAIVAAAGELIERDGVEALSMRKVAARLGVAAMSLYHHVPNKAALVDAVIERLVVDLDFADDPEADPRERARGMMRAFRAAARERPRTVNLVLTRTFETPATLRLFEHALEIARAAGFSGSRAARIASAFVSYVIGALLREARFDRDAPGSDPFLHGPESVDPERFPHLTALLAEGFAYDPDAEFETGLDLLLDGLPEPGPD